MRQLDEPASRFLAWFVALAPLSWREICNSKEFLAEQRGFPPFDWVMIAINLDLREVIYQAQEGRLGDYFMRVTNELPKQKASGQIFLSPKKIFQTDPECTTDISSSLKLG
jgi:hypothetical protein